MTHGWPRSEPERRAGPIRRAAMSAARPGCLVVFPAWVGDAVAANSLLRALSRRRPELALGALAAPALAPLLERMPEIHRLVPSPFRHGELCLGARRRLGRSLRGRCRQAFVLPASAKSALVPWLAGVPVRTGWRGEWRYGLLNDLRHPAGAPESLIERYAALAYPPGDFERPAPLPRLVAPRARRGDRRGAGPAAGSPGAGAVPGRGLRPGQALAAAALRRGRARGRGGGLAGLGARWRRRGRHRREDLRRARRRARALPQPGRPQRPRPGRRPAVAGRRGGQQRFRPDAHCRGARRAPAGGGVRADLAGAHAAGEPARPSGVAAPGVLDALDAAAR